jgi:nucleotide-binding universal stress UspA family protein
MIKRILVPLDGSRMAESVLTVAVAVAKCTSASIILLHIIEDRPPRTIHGEPHLATPQDSQHYLEDLAAQLLHDIPVEYHVHEVEENDVAQSVAAHAEELNVDMIVLCTHGRSGPRRVVWGSIAQQVLRRASVPVLIARPDMSLPNEIKLILLALDGTEAAEVALPATLELASSCGAHIEVVRVVPTAGTLAGDEVAVARLVPTATDATLNLEAASSAGYLVDILERLSEGGATASPQILRGDPVQMVSEAARKSDVSLIVVATHGRSGLGTLWTGSVGASLLSSADRPLLLVRIPDSLPGGKS